MIFMLQKRMKKLSVKGLINFTVIKKKFECITVNIN